MSKVALSGNASGTGTFTIASPNGNTDRTINLPDSNGTILTTATAGVPVNGPAFSAWANSNVIITTSTWTKVQLNSKDFDTASSFDNSTNYRFQPTIAGYYQISGGVRLNGSAAITQAGSAIYKNGSAVRTSLQSTAAAYINIWDSQVSGLVYLNGSTDYIELYAFNQCSTNPIYNSGQSTTYLTGFLARSAT